MEPSRKRARFVELAESAARAVEEAAKRVNIAKNFATDLYELSPLCPGAEDTCQHMEELNEQTAKTWAMALESKTVFQNSAEIIELRKTHSAKNRADRKKVAQMMGVVDDEKLTET